MLDSRRRSPWFVIAFLLVVTISSGAIAETSLVRIAYKGAFQIEQLQKRNIEILALGKDGMLDVLATDQKQLDYLLSQRYPASVISTESMTSSAVQLDSNLGLYHTYSEMESVLTSWESTYPALVQVDSIGASIEDRAIWMMKISDNVSVDESEPEVLYMGNHHARELMSVDIPLRFAGYLLANYGVDSHITDLVNTREIFFIPMVNPDGHVYVENNHAGYWGSWWRKNRRNNGGSFGVDLNRNYGYQWGYDNVGSSPSKTSTTYRGTAAWSEPETQTIRDFVNAREIVMWFSYHSYGELLLYPWGYIASHTPDNAVFRALGQILTDDNGYFAGDVLDGAIYLVNGDTDDWGYGEQITKGKIFAFTPEVNTSGQGGFGPPDSLIQPTFDLLLEMNIELLEYADNPYSVVGPYGPTMYALDETWYPTHTVKWSSNDPVDPNPVQYYELERCDNPHYVTDQCESAGIEWVFEGFSLDNDSYSGVKSYYSGQGNNLAQKITTERPYFVEADTDTFRFWTKYDIEPDWDYAYVLVSIDGGSSFTSIPGNITTATNPNGTNIGHGITGFIPIWVQAVFPLTAYLGQEIKIRLLYSTDAAVVNPGIWADVITPVPRCDATTILSSTIMDTCYQVIPTAAGTVSYRVRATDAENDDSEWSSTVEIFIDEVTAAGDPPRYASQLQQNYPNPFNPITHIPFVVGGRPDGPAQTVSLRIYDVSGKLVKTLLGNELQSPGRHRSVWNGRDEAGRPVASGIYFSRLAVGTEASVSRKLVLLK